MGRVCGFVFAMATLLNAQTADDVFRAIRAGDLDALRKMPANVKDRLDNTPLHYAALYGNAESVRILLERGADVKARNKSDATPLIYAAYNFDKTRLLVEKGSDINAKSTIGMTPLLVAVSVHGNTETVRYLLEKGADIKALTRDRSDALQLAAAKGEAEMVRMLLDKGADAKRVDEGGFTALHDAFSVKDPARVKMLLTAGSDVNVANLDSGKVKNGPIQLIHMTPVFLAAPDAEPATVKALLAAGAHADEPDNRKLTPLMYAILTDQPKLDTVRALIAAGADVNAKDATGDSVLDWALKYRNPEVLAILKKAGARISKPYAAPHPPADFAAGAPKDAVARSSALLVKSGEAFFVEGGGCVGCHHQPLDARVFASLRAANAQPDARLRRIFLDGVAARRPGVLSRLPLQVWGGGDYDEMQAMLEGMADLGEPASPTSDAMIHYLVSRQETSGAWVVTDPRPPINSSSITRTAIGIRVLKAYEWPGRREEFDERIARARQWLLNARPITPLEEADKIMGLKAAGVADGDLQKAVQALVAKQRPDGGFAQTPYLDSDAYATGSVLSTLYQNGFLKPADPAYSRGVSFLLKTQFPDGSWYVRSRGAKLQPYFQSSFPFDHDQWISYTATALAVMALAPALK